MAEKGVEEQVLAMERLRFNFFSDCYLTDSFKIYSLYILYRIAAKRKFKLIQFPHISILF